MREMDKVLRENSRRMSVIPKTGDRQIEAERACHCRSAVIISLEWQQFMAEGQGVKRFDVMYNDFIIIGPRSDPAHITGTNVLDSFRKIAAARVPFVSRGDRSGTNAAELRYWKDAGIDIEFTKGDWYKEIGQGMGPELNIVAALSAYCLADRGTWLSFKNRVDLAIIIEGDRRLFNQYGVMLVNPQKHPNVKVADGQAFVDWLVSPDGQAAIAAYKIKGQQLFFPNASERPS